MYEKKPVLTAILIILNIVVFVVLSIGGSTLDAYYMLKMGAMYPENVVKAGEYWRLVSSMFLHFGLMHLVNNMVMLGASGAILEDALGRVKYIILYVASGLIGSGFSCFMMYMTGDYSVSAGASGAIFGMVGALLWVVIRNKGRYKNISGWGTVAMLALMLYYGISSTGVDNWCHLGGLVAGFVLSIVLYRKKSYNYFE